MLTSLGCKDIRISKNLRQRIISFVLNSLNSKHLNNEIEHRVNKNYLIIKGTVA